MNNNHPSDVFQTAQNDDPELLEWLANAASQGGGFVKSLAMAALNADHGNYPVLRPVLLVMRAKYPRYEPTAEVKAEIRAWTTTSEKPE
jgi:hypothetical protein